MIDPHADNTPPTRSANAWFRHALFKRRALFIDGAVAALTINCIALATSFYSMQVYDRVLPSMGYATLWVMTVGVLLAIALELGMRHLRARLVERACKAMDEELSSVFFGHALAIRMDCRPHTVGTFAAQIRQFEMVRNFLTSTTMFVLADAPFALLFVGVMALIAGPLALVPLVLLVLAVLTGLMFRTPLARRAEAQIAESNQKNGLLIEAIDGIESVKAAGAEWKLLDRWRRLTRRLADNEVAIRDLSNLSTQLAQTLQQLAYVGLVAVGAHAIGAGNLTIGGLIACTIISGRALGPIAQLPGLIVQWQHARFALRGLDQIMALPTDSPPRESRMVPGSCQGRLRLDGLRFAWGPDAPALAIDRLVVQPGERVAVLGAVGSGKSTFMKLLSGLYRPAGGRVFLDDVDMAQLAPEFLREHIGYLPQDVRLFQGSLRDNLTLGLAALSDDQILAAARLTGLDRVIAAHPRGLGLEISEGGRGLSGGQRQLAGLTRLLLARPRLGHARGHHGAGLAGWRGQQLGRAGGQHLDLQVDAVQQRAAESPLVTRHRLGRAAAGPARGRARTQPAAGAGVHGRHQLEAGREHRLPRRAADGDAATFHGLAQRLQRGAREFRGLVQEQHATMGQADLTRPRRRAPAHQGHGAGGVVRRPQRPPALGLRIGHAHRLQATQGGTGQRFFFRQGRQQAGQALGQHALAGARRPHQQQAVFPCRRDLQCALGRRLTLHLGQVGPGQRRRVGRRLRARQRLGRVAGQQGGHHLGQVTRTVHHLVAHLGGELRTVPGQDQAAATAAAARRQGQRQGPAHRAQFTGQRQFARTFTGRQALRAQHPGCGQHPQRDGQVEAAAFLGQLGWRQVDGDALVVRVGQAALLQRRAHTFAAFLHLGLGQAHQHEAGQAVGQLHLDLHLGSVQAVQGTAVNHGQRHQQSPPCAAPTRVLRA